MTRRSALYRTIILLTAFLIATTQDLFGIGFDSTFGSGGKFMTTFSDTGEPSASGTQIFIQPSGRILVVGYHSQQGTSSRTSGIALTGLTSGGIIDTSFGTSGKMLVWSAAFSSYVNNALSLSDGSILVMYQFWESVSNNRPGIVKLTPAGQVDASFDPDLNIFPNETNAVRIAPARDGKVYAMVRTGSYQHFLVRLNANGSRDETFGSNGVRHMNLNRLGSLPTRPRVFGLQELSDGKLVVAGAYYSAGFGEGQSFVARFDTDTNLDRSFGTQGLVRLAIPYGSVEGDTLRVLGNGKIMIGGAWTFLGSTTLLVRLTSRGRLDAGFGIGGIVQTNFNDWNGIRSIAAASDGAIFVAGSCGDKAIPSNQRLFLTKYTETGTVDASLVTNFIGTREAGASDVLLQSDGKLVIAGFTQNAADNFSQLTAARFTP